MAGVCSVSAVIMLAAHWCGNDGPPRPDLVRQSVRDVLKPALHGSLVAIKYYQSQRPAGIPPADQQWASILREQEASVLEQLRHNGILPPSAPELNRLVASYQPPKLTAHDLVDLPRRVSESRKRQKSRQVELLKHLLPHLSLF